MKVRAPGAPASQAGSGRRGRPVLHEEFTQRGCTAEGEALYSAKAILGGRAGDVWDLVKENM